MQHHMELGSICLGFINYIYLYAEEGQVTVHMATEPVWRSEDNLGELVFSSTM